MNRHTLSIAALLAWAGTAQAALFSSNAVWTSGPSTQLGTIVSSSMAINNGPTSFTVSGYVDIQVTAGAHSGTLLTFTVDRPLNPAYLPAVSTMQTVTSLTGFSLPPAGSTFGPTSGQSYTEFNNYPGISKSLIPLTLVNGAATWNTTISSPTFTYTTGGVQYVRQIFDLDGVILTGPGGIWKVDFPLTSAVVPEPTTLLVLAFGCAATARRRRRSRRS